MGYKSLACTVLFASLTAVALSSSVLFDGALAAQAARSLPRFTVDPAWPKVPPNMKLGDVSSIAIDALGNAYLLHRPRTLEPNEPAAPPVVVFDPEGNFLRAWGGDGPGYEWPQREHGIHIDYKGFVWLGGNNCPTNGLPRVLPVADDQLLKFTLDGRFILQIGKSNQSKGNADTMNLHRPADAQVHPLTNELFVADGYGNHRVAVFDADTGAFKRMWGAFGNAPVDADSCEVITYQTFSDPGPAQFSIVHALRVAHDGTVYVADREHRRVQMFDKDGKFLKQIVYPQGLFARNIALSPDSDQQFLYVGGGREIFVLDRKTLDILGAIQGEGIIGGGHHLQTDMKGNLYVAATGQGTQRLLFQGLSAR